MPTSELFNRRQGASGLRAYATSHRNAADMAAASTSSSIAHSTSRRPLENATAEMLEADNRQLALKLRYLQSVTTIYRQRIAGITRDALSSLGLGPDHVKKISLSIEDAEAVALKAMKNFDEGEAEGGPTNSSPSKAAELRALLHETGAATTSLPPTRVISTPRRASKGAGYGDDSKSGANNEADFWRQQFINLMSEMRPVSMQDAEILMRALAEKKSLAEEVDSLRARLSAGSAEGGDTSPARGAEEGGAAAGFAVASPAPREVNNASEDTVDGTSLGGLVHTPAASVAAAHQHNNRSHFNPQVGLVLLTSSTSASKSTAGIDGIDANTGGEGDLVFAKVSQPTNLEQALKMIREEQTKNKVLRVRLSSLQKQMAAREDTFSSDLIAVRTENVRIVSSMSAAARECEAMSQQVHEYRQKMYANEKTLMIKDGQLQRQITKTEALEKELEAAMKRMQTVFSFDEERKAAESAELQKASEDQERLLREMKVLSDELQTQQVKQDETVRELNKYQTMLKTAEAVNDQLRAEINAMEQARLMSEWESDSVQSLLPRMEDAATELEQYFTFRDVTMECERINGQLRTIATPGRLLAYLKKVVLARDEEIRLLREEADRAVSVGVPPSVGAIVDTQLLFTSTPSITENEDEGRDGDAEGDNYGGGKRGANEEELRLLQQRLAGRRHVLLRQEGTWMEIRDVGTGKLRFVTTDVDHTPFAPNSQLIATKKEREAEAARAATAAQQSQSAALSQKKVTEDEMAAKMAEGIAKAVAEERARLETHYNELLANVAASHDASANVTDTNNSATPQEANDRRKEGADSGPSIAPPPHEAAEDLSPSSLSPQRKPRYNPDAPIDPAFRPRLIRFFAKYNPSKLTTVDLVMERFRGRYDYMLKKLVAKYGPEPTEVEVSSSSIELPPQAASIAGVGGTRGVRDERIGLSDADEDESSPHRKSSNATTKKESDSRLSFIQPLRERLIRLLHRYDKPRLAAVDSFINGWVEEGLLKLIAQYGTEPSPSATAALPRLPPQQPVGGIDPAEDLKLEPYRRRLIRMYDAYDKDRLRAIDATMRQNATAAQCETLLRKLAVRYGPEPPDDADAKIPTLPPQIDEVPPLPAVALQRGRQGSSSPTLSTPIDNALNQSSHAYPHPSNAGQSSSDTTKSYPTEVRARLYRMFKKYAPEKLSNIDLILGSFHGEYDLMFEKLVAKYGAEPEDDGGTVPEDLPQQALNPVLAARQRAVSMRQASPPSIGSGRGGSGAGAAPKQPAASSPRKVPTPSSPSASPAKPNSDNDKPLASPKARPAPSPKPTAAAAKSSPSLSPQRAKAPPPAAIAAMKVAAAAPAASVDDAKADSKSSTPLSSRTASPAKAIVGGRPRGTKAPPPSAALLQARPSSINTDDI